MNQPISSVTIEPLTHYSQADASSIGTLLTHLSTKFDGSPVPESVLNTIIASPYHEQFVARDDKGNIIGTVTVSLTMGAGVARGAWLEDFVVNPSAQGAGVGGKLWEAVILWSKTMGAHKLDFTSSPSKEAAQHFYRKHGAVIRETNYFRKSID